MEFGISTFGEVQPDHKVGEAENSRIRVQQLLQEARLADSLGLDVFALGEHHRPDYVVSAPEVMLAAIAAQTQKIRLSSAVTVLSSADPVRTFQNFATLDLISNGRAEIIAGRGSFIESFPLFGYSLDDYDKLFEEKLDLLLTINHQEIVSWKGDLRAPIQNKGVYPRPTQSRLPVWIGVGGTPASVIRAGRLNLPLVLAILGTPPERFSPLVTLYRKSATEAGHEGNTLPVCLNQHLYLADDSARAAEEYWPVYEKMMNRIGRERGWSPLTREHFEAMRGSYGSLLVGSPEEVADKLISQYRMFKNDRFLAQTIMGDIAHDKMMNSLELYGSRVVPLVQKAIRENRK